MNNGINSIPARIDTSSIAEDKEFQRLFLAFANAKMELTAYMDEMMSVKVVPVNVKSEE